MKKGNSRFEHYLHKLEQLLDNAVKDHNPALWLYSNDARTPLFMLEGLSKLYEGLHNKKKFGKLKEHFKLLEDGIGQIDYYEYYAKVFLESPTIPVPIREYMQAQSREKIQHLNDILISEKWITDGKKRLSKIRKSLKKADWLTQKEEVTAVRSFYEKEISSIKSFVKEANGQFTEMENQVHEFRRDIRWLSIYPQALQGMIQLSNSGLSEHATAAYCTEEIVHSKFNVMPDAGDQHWFLLLEKNYFYALSWVIATMGDLKDEGLQVFAVTEALQQVEQLSQEDAHQKAFELLGVPTDFEQNILQKASTIVHDYIHYGLLDQLVYHTAYVKAAAVTE